MEATLTDPRNVAVAMGALAPDFYARPVLEVAPDLIGCVVAHGDTAGVIVETEAYHESEPASHAFVGLTARTKTLFGPPGVAYVYRSYGIHALLNAVCEPDGIGAGVLIRALEPLTGIELMRARRQAIAGRPLSDADLCSGPGKLTQALGVELSENGTSLSSGPVRICERAQGWRPPTVVEGTRVGISHAVELRWRFCASGNENVSRPRPGQGPAPARRRRPEPARRGAATRPG